MEVYPCTFEPLYQERIWGGRNLERLFARRLPAGKKIGESWELSDLAEGTSRLSNGPCAGWTLTELTHRWGDHLLGGARPMPDDRFPLLLKFLDAGDILSLQVHPDERAAREIGGGAAAKTECWYVVESRGGFIYKGLLPGVTSERFRQAVDRNEAESVVRRVDVAAGDFHYLPAGTVHALGPGVVVAEAQTPSDTTFRVTDWGRGRPTHLEESMRCIRLGPASDEPPGRGGDVLVRTPRFTVRLRSAGPKETAGLPEGRCCALMVLRCDDTISLHHAGAVEPVVRLGVGRTALIPAALKRPQVQAGPAGCQWLQIALGDP